MTISTEMSGCFLDENQFHDCCKDLLQHSDTIRDGWIWEPGQSPEDGYLRRSALGSGRVGCSTDQDEGEGGVGSASSMTRQDPEDTEGQQMFTAKVTFDDDDDDDDDDDAAMDVNEDVELACSSVSRDSEQVVQYEHHILFSCSYQTPVLYFRASTLDGRSLSLEEVWNNVHPSYRVRFQNSPWDSITQQEHPLLGQPFFMLHPCKTEEFMRPVMQAALEEHRQVNYVVTWLSVVGPLVGLNIPLSYFTRVPLLPAQGSRQT